MATAAVTATFAAVDAVGAALTVVVCVVMYAVFDLCDCALVFGLCRAVARPTMLTCCQSIPMTASNFLLSLLQLRRQIPPLLLLLLLASVRVSVSHNYLSRVLQLLLLVCCEKKWALLQMIMLSPIIFAADDIAVAVVAAAVSAVGYNVLLPL